jgi:hypothetical protein
MKYAILIVKLLAFSYLGYLLYFLATGYDPTSPTFNPPFVIVIVDLINLFIHEAGHALLRVFGMVVHMLGGSLFQVLLPLALVVVTARKKLSHAVFPAFWLGENLVNVSVYIRDAPYKHMKLIAQGLIHDWNWLLGGNLDLAEPLGTAVFLCGLTLCAAALVIGTVLAIRDFKHYRLVFEE